VVHGFRSGVAHLYPFGNRTFTMNSKGKFDRRMMASAFIAAFLAAGCASPDTATPQTASGRERTQIEQRLREVLAAAENKDFNRLDRYHLYGPKFTKFSGSSSERLDATAGRKGEHDGLGAANGLKMRADALKIDVFGNVGIATFILDYSFDSGGQAIHRKNRSTLVFVKEGGAWKIAHEHLSPIHP
jgi:ketosteroid isomerase-like protein